MKRLPLRNLWITAAGLWVLGLIGLFVVGQGDDEPSARKPAATTTSTAPAKKTTTTAEELDFDTVSFRIRRFGEADPGPVRCALLARTTEQLAQGLMGRRDLAGYDAMIFAFGEDTTSPFWMKNVPVPLSIAWFDSNGLYVSSADMAPCMRDDDECPRYKAAGEYRYAMETLEGDIAKLGVATGATLSLGESCEGSKT